MKLGRKLVFHFSLLKNWKHSDIVKLHLNCLKAHSSVFSESLFVIAAEEPESEDIIEFEHLLIDLGFKNIQFKVTKLTKLCESKTFCDEILDKIDVFYDGLICFGHSLGVIEEYLGSTTKDQLYEYICGAYYNSIRQYNEAEWSLYGIYTIVFGSYFTYGPDIPNKYHWRFSGNFFWINTGCLDTYLKLNNITITETDRIGFLDLFLGNIIDCSGMLESAESVSSIETHNGAQLSYCYNFYEEAEYYNRLLLNEYERKNFNKFKKRMTKKL